ncbi:NadS family protein [Candidatus Halobeggiatoa sp. HSG11]|nr:NadS family protein [Candidatus Halobeggiatoa sp. HSG11]
MDNESFNELMSSVQEAGKIMRGEIEASHRYEFDDPDVKAIREHIKFSQAMFANLIGVNVQTIETWEQGSSHPTGPAKVLLKLVQVDPESVLKNLDYV